MMDKKGLEEYVNLKKEIAYLEEKLEALKDKEIPVIHDKVKGSMATFPYIEFHMDIEAEEPVQAERKNKLIAYKKKRIAELQDKAIEIEEFIENIEDSITRQIFELKYIDGLKLEDIAELIGYDRSTIGKKIKKYLKECNYSHNSHK